MMQRQAPIRLRLWLAAALPALLAAATLLLVFLGRYSSDLTEAWQERARVAALQLAGAAEFPLFANDVETLQRLVDASRKGDGQLRAVALYDPTGRLKVSAGAPEGPPLPFDGREQVRIDASLTVLVPITSTVSGRMDLFTETTTDRSGESAHSAANRGGMGAAPQGYVMVQLGLDSLKQRRSELLAWTGLATAAAMVLAAVLSSLIASRVTRPIAHISEVVQQIGAGRLDARTEPARGGPLAELAMGVNEMAAQVAMTQQELRQQIDLATTELRQQKDVAEQAARLDALTQVLGRRGFTELAEAEIQRCMRYPHALSLIMIDIDHFKTINDTHGHAAGDAVLVHFAQLLKRELRECDVVGRIGGEEFAVLLPDSTAEQAAHVAERMRASVAQALVHVRGQPLQFTASFGVAEFQPQELTLDSLLARADAALYDAKHQGRNRVVLASPPGVA